MLSTAIFLLCSLPILHIWALPQGAPTKVCQSMLPAHGNDIVPQLDISPYSIHVRNQNGAVLVTVGSALGVPFGGFMLQGRRPDGGAILGVFQPSGQDVHTIDCAETGDTLTHNDSQNKESVEVMWYPPPEYDGVVIFNATIAQNFQTYWVGVESKPFQIDKRSINDPVPNYPGRNPVQTTPPYFTPEISREASTILDPFYEGCATTKLCFGSPAQCIESKNCKAAVAVKVIGESYEFELKAIRDGPKSPVWVAAGLSEDAKMGEDSVIECVKKGNNIAAYMSWTSGSPNYAATRLSNPQLGIRLLNGSIIDDTLYCKVRRDARTVVRGKTFDLVNDKFNLLVASGASLKTSPPSVGFHDITFLPSAEAQSLADVSALAPASKLLIRLHGSFMLAAWIFTASIGILLARYYRTTWSGSSLGGKDLWFAWHRMFMVLTWLLTMAAFILIFVELKAWSAEDNPHAILGTIATILCFFQPIGAYFRPHPGTPKRPLFNWLHWLAGNTAHIIAIVAIFFAVRLTKAELPEYMDWILVAYVAYHVIVHLVLSISNCVSEKSSERRVTAFPMKDLSGSGRSSAYADRSADSPHSGFRKFILAIYIVGVLLLAIALIVITAGAPIEASWNSLKSSMSTGN